MDHDAQVTRVVTMLDRPLYGVGQAAGLLGVRGSATLWRWLDGYHRGDTVYPPVIRPEPTGIDVLTWGEFVEARYLARLRDSGVSLQALRGVVERLREQFNTEYPLAHAKPFFDGQDVVMRVQEEEKLPKPLRIVVVKNGQTKLSTAAADFVRDIDYDEDVAARVRPAGRTSPVVIDPARGFGMPSLVGRNLRTEVLAELSLAGDSNESIAAAYDLTTDQVEAALRFELQVARDSAA